MLRKKDKFIRHFAKKESKEKKEFKNKNQMALYKCKKPGHLRSNCPNLNKDKIRKILRKRRALWPFFG